MSDINEQKLIELFSDKYTQLTVEERQELHALFSDDKTREELKKQAEKLIFYKRPPTPEEFLDPSNDWLPENVISSIYPHIKQEFCEILNWGKTYNKVVEYGATRLGKSFLARLLMIYSIVYIHHLREPAMYYGLSPLTELCLYLISFKFDKTRQLYLQPIYKILKKSKRFKQIKFQDRVAVEQRALGVDTIVWSKAAETGEITLASGLQIQIGNDDALSSIGSDVLQAYISEIGYFCEYAGATEEGIYRIATDIADRINATVGHNYLAFTYLDTSANNADSMIENYIIKELQFRESTHFKWQSRWEARPYKFPIWEKTGETFTVITGQGSIPAKIVTDSRELEGIPKDLIIQVPIDVYDEFKDNLLKSIKDIAGRPTSSENRFISDFAIIDRMFNNKQLTGIEGTLYADAGDSPEGLLWEQIKGKCWHRDFNGKYKIIRASNEYRYIGIDNAFSLKGDVMGITVLHKEWSQEKQQAIYVIDFMFTVQGKDTGINLDSPTALTLDMMRHGNTPMYALYSDTFHSEAQKQFLSRNNVDMIKQSVDSSLNPYQFLLTCMTNGTIKGHRNIFLKNNLMSLMRSRTEKGKEKIDHNKGTTENKYTGDYEHSKCGVNAKDLSDSLTQALWGAYNHNHIPTIVYEIENRTHSSDTTDLRVNMTQATTKLWISANRGNRLGSNAFDITPVQ